ncbi:hypothetical protein PpBr36_01666 [Pyricularia pennisetigena]|uniref:hypothetical protein n=1 Tax=Pyricularia pennisetigena TaxID=1578925 RepID=UPI00114FB03A|nr:hypothetical protein PpBr36_01666 [Pyricularia pennisetigena]TLS28118.1 hypothetical protein PpBr36_01666 [Pyricularia pennisetigena]
MASLQRILRPVATRQFATNLRISSCSAAAAPTTCCVAAARRFNSTKPAAPDAIPDGELGVGELQGAKFRIEPLRRVGEDARTMRARLQRQSRGRGTLESELLLSTFAKAHLPTMSVEQMQQYDRFLDENDWDIYYWATQSEDGVAENGNQKAPQAQTPTQSPRPGEWAQTVGTFKPAYRPVPSRWKDSEILALLRRHVRERSAAGVLDGGKQQPLGNDQARSGNTGGGMAFMPPLN